MKNILVLTGSPRKGGNSDLLADAFIKGAEEAGHKVSKFASAEKKIAGCRACDKCWSTGTACIFPDDFRELAPLVEEADTLVIVSPVYWFTMSAQIKAAIDRLYAYYTPNRKKDLKLTETVLLSCAADEPSVFKGLEETYKSLLAYTGWRNAGIITVPEVSDKGDILKTDALTKAEELGKSI